MEFGGVQFCPIGCQLGPVDQTAKPPLEAVKTGNTGQPLLLYYTHNCDSHCLNLGCLILQVMSIHEEMLYEYLLEHI